MAQKTETAVEAAAPVVPALSSEQFAQLLQAMATNRQSLDADTLKVLLTETAQISAQSMQKAMKPENQTHPGKSVFSHPDGDEAIPKPPLPYELYWNGYPVHKFPETETWKEWLAQSNLPGPGTYGVIRNDGSKMTVTVEAEINADGKMTKVKVSHPSSREDKDKVPSKPVIIAQMGDPDHAKDQFLKTMREQFEAMFGER